MQEIGISVIVMEQSFTGHRLSYVRHLMSLARASQVPAALMTSADALRSPEFEREFPPDLRPTVLGKRLIRRAHFVSHVLNVARVLRQAKRLSAIVVVPNFDEKMISFAVLSAFFPSIPVRGIVMRPPSGKGAANTIKRRLIIMLRKRGMDVRELTSPLAPLVRDSDLIDPSGLFAGSPPRHSEITKLQRDMQAWRSASPKPVVGVVGVLNSRKSIVELIDAVTKTREVRLLLVGKPSNEELAREYLHRIGDENPDVFAHFGSVSEPDFNGAVAGSDVLALLYTNEVGSSGLLTHALMHGVPVIGYRNETINEAITRLRAGLVLDSLTAEDIVESIEAALRMGVVPTTLDPVRAKCESQWCELVRRSAEPRT